LPPLILEIFKGR